MKLSALLELVLSADGGDPEVEIVGYDFHERAIAQGVKTPLRIEDGVLLFEVDDMKWRRLPPDDELCPCRVCTAVPCSPK